jgi:hypothetical protein
MTFTAMQHAVTASMLLADLPLLGTWRPVSPGRSPDRVLMLLD